MEKGRINYEEFLKKNFWPLHEAVSLVVGDVPTDDNLHTRNLLTYKRASEAIESGALESETKEIWFKPLEGVEGYNLVHCIQPRTFMKWYIENEGESAPKELLKFFNYDYWFSKKCWTFSEMALLLLSKNEPPFPHEIRNVFEIDEKHMVFAYNLAQKILDTNLLSVAGAKGLLYSTPSNPKKKEGFRSNAIELDTESLLILLSEGQKNFSLKRKIQRQSYISDIKVPKLIQKKADEIFEKVRTDRIRREQELSEMANFIKNDGFDTTLTEIKSICTAEFFLRTIAQLPTSDKELSLLEEIVNRNNHILRSGQESELVGAKRFVMRFKKLEGYEFLFRKDYKLGMLNFLDPSSIDPLPKKFKYSDLIERRRRPLDSEGRFIDFIEWARSRKIEIPLELEEVPPSKAPESGIGLIRPSKRKRNLPITQKICLRALELLQEKGLCNLDKSSSEFLWKKIMSVCDVGLERKSEANNKFSPEEAKLNEIRVTIKRELSLEELLTSKHDSEKKEDSYICYKNKDSMMSKKRIIKGREVVRNPDEAIKLSFSTFDKNLLRRFKEILGKN